jgi:ABC-type nitrate/sulfonate/bicarbonate transport system permease component
MKMLGRPIVRAEWTEGPGWPNRWAPVVGRRSGCQMDESSADRAVGRGGRRLRHSGRVAERLLAIGFVVLWLVFWEFSIQSGMLDRRFFPAPTSWLGTFVNLVSSGELWRHLSAMVQRLVVGYLGGAIPALLIGWTIGRRRWLNAGCGPLLLILGAFPSTALLPLFWIVFNLELARPVTVAASVFFPILYCTRIGVQPSPAATRQIAVGLEPVPPGVQGTLARAGLLGSIFLGLKLATSFALLTLIAVEILVRTSGTPSVGLGYLIWQSWLTFSVETLSVGIAVAGVLGALAWLAVDLVERLVIAVLVRRARET